MFHSLCWSCWFLHDFYRKFPTDLSALLLGDLYYTRLSLNGVSEHLSHSALLDLFQILHANLSSNVSKVGLQSQLGDQSTKIFYFRICHA